MDDSLQQAIGLIRAGRKAEARPLLQRLIQTDPRNVSAWLWYVETCQTQAERLKVVEACARFNPDHPQVERALALVRPAPPGAVPPESAPVRAWDPKPYEPPKEPQPAWEYTPPPAPPPKPEPPARSYAWYEVWWEVLSYRPVEAFEDLLRDPGAKAGRAYLWMAIAGLVSTLISIIAQSGSLKTVLNSPEIQQRGFDLAAFTIYVYAFLICMIPFGALGSVLSLMFAGAIQNLLAKMFGGSGNYAGTVYLLGAMLAPITMLTNILNLFVAVAPILVFVLCCLSIPIIVYQIMLNVRVLMAAHQIDALKALGVIVLPGIGIFFFVAILAALFAPSMGEIMQQLEAMATPTY